MNAQIRNHPDFNMIVMAYCSDDSEAAYEYYMESIVHSLDYVDDYDVEREIMAVLSDDALGLEDVDTGYEDPYYDDPPTPEEQHAASQYYYTMDILNESLCDAANNVRLANPGAALIIREWARALTNFNL